MWNKLFEGLQWRMTCISAAIFGVLSLVIVFVAYGFIWWNVLQHEKEELVDNIYHEAEEWVESGELPCSTISIREGSMLAYYVKTDGVRACSSIAAIGRKSWIQRVCWIIVFMIMGEGRTDI